jgi:predicted HD phosphohydrolase
MVMTSKSRKLQKMNTCPEFILELYWSGGDRQYSGEPVTQWVHAWQCSQLAAKAEASPALQLASFLHDVGHLWVDGKGTPTLRGEDDLHENAGAILLEPVFGKAVSEPVRLHVRAKRYLVTTSSTYARILSPDSLRSLNLQGGLMSAQEREAFEAELFFADALTLRVWDDMAKKEDSMGVSKQEASRCLVQLMDRVLGRNVTKI